MQEIKITSLNRLLKFDWTATLLATADPYLVWADLTDASAILSPMSESEKVKSVRLFVEKVSNGGKSYVTENWRLDKLEERLLIAAKLLERIELASPLRSRGATIDWRQGGTKALFEDTGTLSGNVLAVIDFGCPFAHRAFMAVGSTNNAVDPANEPGDSPNDAACGAMSRVRYFWDQDPNRTVRPVTPNGEGHQIKYIELASLVPPINLPIIHTLSDTHFLSDVTPPQGADFAYWFSQTLPAKFDAQDLTLECQFSLIDEPADSLAALPVSKYWSPPYIAIPSACDGQAINYGRELVPKNIKALFDDCKGATEAEIYAAANYYDVVGNTSHGAHILSTATGWPYLAEPLKDPPAEQDAASKVDVIFVQLPATTVADTSGNSLGGYVNDALEYILARTADDSKVVVNLSYGCYAGPHDGSSLIEKAMDAAIERGRKRTESKGFDVIVAAGNSFQAGCHAMLKLKKNVSQKLEWAIQPDDETWSFVEIWYRNKESVKVSVTPPFATTPLGPAAMNSVLAFGEGDTPLCTIVHTANASERDGIVNRMALIAVAPTRDRTGTRAIAPYGVWTIVLSSDENLRVDAWIERDDPILVQALERRQSVFVTKPQDDDYVDKDYIYTAVTKYQTINGISTGNNTIPVGSTVRQTKRPSRYSAAAARRGGKRVQETCDADEATVLAGSLAFGNYGSGTYRRTGTSVAAAMHSRNILNAISATTPARTKLPNGGGGTDDDSTVDDRSRTSSLKPEPPSAIDKARGARDG